MLVFLSPLFLWGLAALTIPLVLHLLQRRRTVRTPFPTVRFLKLAQKRSSSRLRFENILLWLLRSLLLAALAVAFALPVIRKSAAADWLTRTRRDVVIVLDGSYSMAYETERGPVFDAAQEAAAALIGSLAPGDRVCVYLAADTPTPVIEKPTAEHATALQAVRSLAWRHGSSAIGETVALALHTLDQQRDGDRDRELYILTDGQALPWQDFRAAADTVEEAAAGRVVIAREQRERIPLFVLLAGAEKPENVWPASVQLASPLLLAGQTAHLAVKLGRSGPARNVSLSLLVGAEERLTRGVLAEADTETAVDLALPGLDPGNWTARVRTTVDALPCDDEFVFLLRVRRQLPVLAAGPPAALRFLRAALSPGGAEDDVRAVTPAELDAVDLSGFEALFLADAFPLSGQTILRIEEYVRAGGVLAIFPGDQAAPGAYASLAILPAQVRDIARIPVAAAARPIGRASRDDEIFRNFRFPRGVVPTVALKRALVFEPPEAGASVVLTAGSEQPFLLARGVGRGQVFQFAVSADRDWSTLPLTAFFVPVVHQIIRHGAGAARHPPAVPLHTELAAVGHIPAYRGDDRILAPSGGEAPVRDADTPGAVIEPLSEPGVYTRVRAAGGEAEAVLAANADRAESRLDPASAAEIAEWTAFKTFRAVRTPEDLRAAVDDLRQGRSLVEPLLWIVLALALAEWGFANRTLRKGAKLTDTLTIDFSGKVTGTR